MFVYCEALKIELVYHCDFSLVDFCLKYVKLHFFWSAVEQHDVAFFGV